MPSLGSWRRLSPWFTQVNKHPLLLGLGLGLVGLGLNLFPLSLTEGISLYLGLIPAILPAVTHGLASGLISCGIAALAFLSRPEAGLGAAVLIVGLVLVAGLKPWEKLENLMIEGLGLFFLIFGVLVAEHLEFLAPQLDPAVQRVFWLSHALIILVGVAVSRWIGLLLPGDLHGRGVPIAEYITRGQSVVMIAGIAAIAYWGTGRITNLTVTTLGLTPSLAVGADPTAGLELMCQIISYWLGCLLFLTLTCLVATRVIVYPLTSSIQHLIRVSTKSVSSLKALENLRDYRSWVSELDLLKNHIHRTLGKLQEHIESLTQAYRRITEQNQRLIVQSLEMELLARKDHLTGLHNDGSLENHFDLIWPLVQQGELNVVLLMIDVDNFKQYNDTYGHLAGNKVLANPTTLQQVDSDDIVARYGGEEFVIVLHDTSAERGKAIAEEIRARVATTLANVTISIGVSQIYPDDTHWESALNRTDIALYQAKSLGRNRVATSSS